VLLDEGEPAADLLDAREDLVRHGDEPVKGRLHDGGQPSGYVLPEVRAGHRRVLFGAHLVTRRISARAAL
jgi:hypothetical protein